MKKIVYDLDGTLVKFNTFKYWIIISFLYPLITLRFRELIKISSLIIGRISGENDRLAFKSKLLAFQSERSYWSQVGKAYAYLLYKFFIRKELFVDKYKEDKACLATAAPDIYAVPLSNYLNIFSCVLCTYVKDNDMVEVFSENKKDFVMSFFDKNPDVLYTDHSDDIPLSLVCNKTFFVSPKDNCLNKIVNCKKMINYEIIK